MKRRATWMGWVVLGLMVSPALAAPGELYYRLHRVDVNSGLRANLGDADRVVFSEIVEVREAPWLRLVFGAVRLEGCSYLQITSQLDGETQVLDRLAVAQWQNTTAYFNGSAVTVELIAARGTRSNSVEILGAIAGAAPPKDREPGERNVCQPVDTREPSGDWGTARLLPIAGVDPADPATFPGNDPPPQPGPIGTGFIISVTPADNPHDRCMLTAGHCLLGVPHCTIAQFEPIPPSDLDCNVYHPPIAKQFAINPAWEARDKGAGDDWGVFRCFPNPATGLTVFQEQLAAYDLAAVIPGIGTEIKKFGYGDDGNPAPGDGINIHCICHPDDADSVNSYRQQWSRGTITSVLATILKHNLHTCPGDSGAPISTVDNGLVVAINTHGGCTPDMLPENMGTAVNNAGLLAAIAAFANPLVPPAPPYWWGVKDGMVNYAFAKWDSPPGANPPAGDHWNSNWRDRTDFTIGVARLVVTVPLENVWYPALDTEVCIFLTGTSGAAGAPVGLAIKGDNAPSGKPDSVWAGVLETGSAGFTWAVRAAGTLHPQADRVIFTFTMPAGGAVTQAWAGERSTLAYAEMNGDGVINGWDIAPFVLALISPAAYDWMYPQLDAYRADCNHDLNIDTFDIDPFVVLLTAK